ncbi:Hypothetical protein HVR_LOCUS901 [uncultured virus]|nr:Hypothetical protein HVR_LOCUS901 [uncultured virus]
MTEYMAKDDAKPSHSRKGKFFNYVSILKRMENITGKKWILSREPGRVPKLCEYDNIEDLVKNFREYYLDNVVVLDSNVPHYGVYITENEEFYFSSQENKNEFIHLIDN